MLTNLSIFLTINLVAYEDLGYILIGMLVYTLQPHLHILKRVGIRDIEAENDTLGLLVETQGQRAEPFLPGRVPDFTLHCLPCRVVRRLKTLDHVVKAKCRHVRLIEDSLRVHFKEGCFTDGTISDHHDIAFITTHHF